MVAEPMGHERIKVLQVVRAVPGGDELTGRLGGNAHSVALAPVPRSRSQIG